MNAEIVDTARASSNDISSELWGELYRTYDEAQAATDEYAEVLKKYYGTYETI